MVSIAQPLPACLEADRSPLDAREPTKAPVHELFVSLADAVIGAAYALPSPPESASDDDSTPDSPDEKALRTEALLVRSCHQGWERSFELHHDWPRPALQAPDEILIRNVAVGLNPVDWKSVAYNFGIQNCPWVLGRDIAGVVEEVGTAVTDFQPSQRVSENSLHSWLS